MSEWQKVLLSLLVAAVAVFCVRQFCFTLYTVPNESMFPYLMEGDRVVVSRWSYGLRSSARGIFRYSRWIADDVESGDVIAFNSPVDDGQPVCRRPVYVGQCISDSAVIVRLDSDGRQTIQVPEECIIGRVVMVGYNFSRGRFRPERTLLLFVK